MSPLSPLETIFFAALKTGSPAECADYLDEACAGDVDLRRRVEKMLQAQAQAGCFLESPAADYVQTLLQPPSEQPGDTIGPYKLLQQIGEGGMGVVYMAEQTEPVERRVALKIIKPGMDTQQVIARFEAERLALAMMEHPYIAKVLDAGQTHTGRPYFVMELVTGMPVTQYCDEQHLSPRERLELFVPICQAVQHAHQKGIIHRDLKPSNILVAQYDKQAVPKVIDFGVAKAVSHELSEKTMFTQYGQIVGTIEYMSPEQTQFNQVDVDTRSDIYSLGVLLYELLTGETPFDKQRLRSAAFDEILRIIREEEPPKPSTRLSSSASLASAAVNRRMEPRKLSILIRGELDWIVMKSLEKDRRRRYETANGFAADVLHYLADEPVLACPTSAGYRFRKFARRNKAALATVSFVGLAVLVAVAVSVTSAFAITREQNVTQNALQAETRVKGDLENSLRRERQDSYFHRIALAHRELEQNNLGRVLELLDECRDLREWEWHYLMRICREEPVILRTQTEVNSIAFSSDGELLASAGGDGTIRIWNSKTHAVIQKIPAAHLGFASCVAFHPDGKHLASVGTDAKVIVWDLSSGQPVFSRPCDSFHAYGTAYAAAFSPDGQQLLAGLDGTLNAWDWKHDRLVHRFTGHENRQISVAYRSDGTFATGSWSGSVRLWNPQSDSRPLSTLTDPRNSRHPVSALSFSSDGGLLATTSYDRRVDVWNTTTGAHLHALPHGGLVLCVAFSPDGRRIASAGEDKIVHLWDASTGREVLSLRGHTGMCGCVTFSPDGQRIASACKDGTIRIWDATPLQGHEGQEFLDFREHNDEVWAIAVSPDGDTLASGGFSTATRLWDLQSGEVNLEFDCQRDVVFRLAWSPDGRRIAVAGGDHGLFDVNVCDAKTGQVIVSLEGTRPGGPEYFSAAYSHDGLYLVTGGVGRTLQVWDAMTGSEVVTLGKHAKVIRGVVISRDGLHLASISDDGIVKFWDATRLSEHQDARCQLQAHVHGQCQNIAFSPDGCRLATGGPENTVIIWDVQTGQEMQTLRGHNGDIYTVTFSPDPAGRWVASAGEDSTVRIWDSQTGKPVHSFRGHVGLVSSLAFTPDGHRLISGSRDRTVKVWDVTPWEEPGGPR